LNKTLQLDAPLPGSPTDVINITTSFKHAVGEETTSMGYPN